MHTFLLSWWALASSCLLCAAANHTACPVCSLHSEIRTGLSPVQRSTFVLTLVRFAETVVDNVLTSDPQRFPLQSRFSETQQTKTKTFIFCKGGLSCFGLSASSKCSNSPVAALLLFIPRKCVVFYIMLNL